MRDGHAWSGSEQSDAENAPPPLKKSSTTLEQALGLCDASFCTTTAQLFPDVDSVQATLPPLDGSPSVFQKQDSTAQADCAAVASPLKRLRRSPHTDPDVPAPHRRSPNKGLPHKTPSSNGQSEQSRQTQRSSSEEREVLSQHHKPALCVC